MVFALVTAQNHGKPKLSQVGDPLLERNRRMLDQRLFDLVPLFPRNTEVVASVVQNPTIRKPQMSIVSLVEDTVTTDSAQPTFISYSLANPDTRRIKPSHKEKTSICLASNGTSHWEEIKKSKSNEIVRMK